ncbi:hypothetical protein WA556_005043 [Blastocystis sp. ATCC 50177/Nand II]
MNPFSKQDVDAFLASQHAGTSIKYAYLPTPMIKPVSLLEDLSNFLVFVDLLYPKDYEQFDTDNRLFSVLKYFLSVWSTFSTDVYLPCSPYRGETFACFVNTSVGKVSFLAEECSIHPDVASFIIEDEVDRWRIEGTIDRQNLFCGNSLVFSHKGSLTLTYLPTEEQFVFSFPSITLSGLLFGTPESQFTGDVQMTYSKGSMHSVISFLPRPTIGGDSKVVRASVWRESTIAFRIEGRWDIGFEIIGEDGANSVFMVVSELNELQRFVLKPELQGALESQKVWKPLWMEVLSNPGLEGIKKEYMRLEKQKIQYYLVWEKCGKRESPLFNKTESGYEYKWKGKRTNFIERSCSAPHVEIK